jgi:hypothetical protein
VGHHTTSLFEPYRPPRKKTTSESGLSVPSFTEAILSGVIHLEDIGTLISLLGIEILSHAQTLYSGTKEHIALRLGRPYLCPLGGESSGARIILEDYQPFTLVQHYDTNMPELDWILPSQNSNWLPPIKFGTGQLDCVRWYNSEIDACLDLMILSPPNDFARESLRAQYEYKLKWWNQSLFILLPSALQTSWSELNLPEPEVCFGWEKDQLLCVWFHPNLTQPFQILDIELDEVPKSGTSISNEDIIVIRNIFNKDSELVRYNLHQLKQQLENLGGITITPTKARHMIAVVADDPFPGIEVCRYCSSDLIVQSDDIPSPIDPTSRKVLITICWKLKNPVLTDEHLYTLVQDLTSKLAQNISEIYVEIHSIDIGQVSYILADFLYTGFIGFDQTNVLLKKIEKLVIPIANEFEEALKSHLQGTTRATKDYWIINAGVVWTASS